MILGLITSIEVADGLGGPPVVCILFKFLFVALFLLVRGAYDFVLFLDLLEFLDFFNEKVFRHLSCEGTLDPHRHFPGNHI